MKPDVRATKLWKRLTQAYGARFTEAFGATPTDPWIEALDDLTDEQIAYGLRITMRESPIHPPTLGQFVQAIANMPIVRTDKGPTIQEQLCAYATLKLHDRVVAGTMSDKAFSAPWTYVYREWWDATRPKGSERCAECSGVVIDLPNGDRIGWSVMMMQGDADGYRKALDSFKPGPKARQPEPA